MLQTIGAREKAKTESVFIPWSNLKPTYRGKENHDADPLDLKSIKRMSIMMRRYGLPLRLGHACTHARFSFFGTQEGPFSLSLRSITATKRIPVGYHELESGTSSARRAHWRTWSRSFTVSHDNFDPEYSENNSLLVIACSLSVENLWGCFLDHSHMLLARLYSSHLPTTMISTRCATVVIGVGVPKMNAPLDNFSTAKLNHIFHDAPYVSSFNLKADSRLLSENVAYPSLGITSSKN